MSDEYMNVEESEKAKNMMNQAVIDKILGTNKKKKQLVAKRVAKVLLPPCITYISNRQRTELKLPIDFFINRPGKVRTRATKVCSCGNEGKYTHPKTLRPYCSLKCYKEIQKTD